MYFCFGPDILVNLFLQLLNGRFHCPTNNNLSRKRKGIFWSIHKNTFDPIPRERRFEAPELPDMHSWSFWGPWSAFLRISPNERLPHLGWIWLQPHIGICDIWCLVKTTLQCSLCRIEFEVGVGVDCIHLAWRSWGPLLLLGITYLGPRLWAFERIKYDTYIYIYIWIIFSRLALRKLTRAT